MADPLAGLDPETRARLRSMLQGMGSRSIAAAEPLGAVQGGQAGKFDVGASNPNLEAMLGGARMGFAPTPEQYARPTLEQAPTQQTNVAINAPGPLPQMGTVSAQTAGGALPGEGTPEEQAYMYQNAIPGIADGLSQLRPTATLGETLNAMARGYLGGMGQVKGQLRQDRRQETADAETQLNNALKRDQLQQAISERAGSGAMLDQLLQDPTMAESTKTILRTARATGSSIDTGDLLKMLNPEGAKPVQVGNDIVQLQPDGTMKKLYSAPFAPREGREAPETWNTLPPDEVTKMGFAPGTVVTRSSRGAIQVEQKPSGGGGIQITGYDDAGRPLIQIGGEGQPQQNTTQGTISLTTPTLNKVQPEVIALQEQAARVGQISRGYKPEYQQFATRANSWWTAAKEKLGFQPPAEDQQMLSEYTKFRSDAVGNLNSILKEQSGAAVTTQEAERLQAAIPNVGTGVFDGDSPTEFKAKLDANVNQLKLAITRRIYLMTKGIPFDIAKGDTGGIAIDQMPGILDAEGTKIEQDLIAKGVKPDEAEKQALAQLKQTYGI